MQNAVIDVATMQPLVKSSRMFRYLTDAEIVVMLGACIQLGYEKDERIIAERESSDCLYLIVAGSVRVTVDENGRDVYICTLGQGDVFGEAALFVNLKRTANVAATDSGVTVLRINRADFMKFIREHPAAGIKVLFMIIYSLLAKLREANLELAFERKDDMGQADIDDLLKDYLDTK